MVLHTAGWLVDTLFVNFSMFTIELDLSGWYCDQPSEDVFTLGDWEKISLDYTEM